MYVASGEQSDCRALFQIPIANNNCLTRTRLYRATSIISLHLATEHSYLRRRSCATDRLFAPFGTNVTRVMWKLLRHTHANADSDLRTSMKCVGSC